MSQYVLSKTQTIQDLRRRLLRLQQTQHSAPVVETGLPGLDHRLPHQGISAGSVLEFVSSAEGASACVVALHCIRRLLQNPGALAVIDTAEPFYPAAFVSAGISIDRMLILRPVPDCDHGLRTGQTRSKVLWVLEQTVRCPGVRAVLCRLDRASTTVFRRLQLAAESSGVSVFLLRSDSCLTTASWADVRLLFQTSPVTLGQETVISVQVIYSRHATPTQDAVQLKIDHETGAVSEISQLATSATACTDNG